MTPPEEGTVRGAVEGLVGTLTMGSRHKRNRFDLEMLREIRRVVDWFAKETEVRVLVLQGEGDDFVGGMAPPTYVDPGPDMRVPDHAKQDLLDGVDALNETVLLLRTMPCPSVAAIDGLVAGGGCALAMACDLRIATERARFFFAWGEVGGIPDGGITQTLADAVGQGRARAMLIEDHVISAKRAQEEGLVHHLVPRGELREATAQRAEVLAAKPPHYFAAVKRLLGARANAGLEDQLSRERAEWISALQTEDIVRGFAAQVEGRTAFFEGR